MNKVDLFNHSVGINDILVPQTKSHIPTAKPLASTATNEISVIEHFNAYDIKSFSEKFLTPEIGDGEVLRPDVFNKLLTGFMEKYKESSDPRVQTFVKDIVKPVLENKELLQAYTNLMIGG